MARAGCCRSLDDPDPGDLAGHTRLRSSSTGQILVGAEWNRMFWHISQGLLSLLLPEAQGRFISSIGSGPWRSQGETSQQLGAPADCTLLILPSLGFPTVKVFPRGLCYGQSFSLSSRLSPIWGLAFFSGTSDWIRSHWFFKLVSVYFSGVTLYARLKTIKQL